MLSAISLAADFRAREDQSSLVRFGEVSNNSDQRISFDLWVIPRLADGRTIKGVVFSDTLGPREKKPFKYSSFTVSNDTASVELVACNPDADPRSGALVARLPVVA